MEPESQTPIPATLPPSQETLPAPPPASTLPDLSSPSPPKSGFFKVLGLAGFIVGIGAVTLTAYLGLNVYRLTQSARQTKLSESDSIITPDPGSTPTSLAPTIQASADFLTQAPLEPSLTWKTEENTIIEQSLDIHFGTGSLSPSLKGTAWTAVITSLDGSGLYEPEASQSGLLYDLETLGWQKRFNIDNYSIYAAAADGPMGSHHGVLLLKDDLIQTISFAVDYYPIPDDINPQPCPCSSTLTVFLSNPTPLSGLLPTQ